MTQSSSSKINYNKVLSAIAQDMRNSLTMMFQSLQTLNQQPEQDKVISARELSDINYQVQRINGGLTQIMGLYQAEEDRLLVNIEQVLVHDLLESVICQNDIYSQSTKIDCQLDVDIDLMWYLDKELISYLIDDVLSNAIRYSKDKIIIRAMLINNILEIDVIDDSSGYPAQMIEAAAAPIDTLDTKYGRMGIGLLFSRLIAVSHLQNDITGEIILSNDSELNGSSFKIRLP
ncbi:MAG: HAMP domain-containing histidine kinase [Gammaproteobacteria bacterium]|nr:HAMP domain-containing histidine kinase [Gammaproteobacteria bacterium]